MNDELNVVERFYSDDDRNFSFGLANIEASVPNIKANRAKILRSLDIFRAHNVNVAVFPEFCLGGYFWDAAEACQRYMDKVSIERQMDWIDQEIRPRLDEKLRAVVLNNLRKGPSNKFLNSTFIVRDGFDMLDEELIYDKIFLPGIEKDFTQSGGDDRMIVDTSAGRFGFTTCYDQLFSPLLVEYSAIEKVDAIINVSCWRAKAIREYASMNIRTDTYYGDLWDLIQASTAATNQVWSIACNAVGVHGVSGARFWGGSGIWAPSGIPLIQASRTSEELLIVHNLDIKGQTKAERDDFDYSIDFASIYRPIDGKRCFTRIEDF